nr:thiamine phosphate synthase [Corynebacterium marambiense]
MATDPSMLVSTEKVSKILTESVRAGVNMILVQDRTASDAVFAEQALRIRAEVSRVIAEPGPHTPFHVPVFVHDRFRVALRHGFHLLLQHSDIDYLEARRRMPGDLMIGVSIDEPDALETLATSCSRFGVRIPDVIGIGPVWSTDARRRQVPPLGPEGVDAIARAAATAGVTTIAVGGITVGNVDKLGATAVDTICVSSAQMGADDPFMTARTLLTLFRPAEIRPS